MKTKAEVANLLEKILGYNGEINERFEVILNKMYKELNFLREAGQAEYAGQNSNAFGNFERLASMLKLDRKEILFVYAAKHLDGIVSFLNGHKSQREDVRGRINDVIVYFILLRAMIDDEEGK